MIEGKRVRIGDRWKSRFNVLLNPTLEEMQEAIAPFEAEPEYGTIISQDQDSVLVRLDTGEMRRLSKASVGLW